MLERPELLWPLRSLAACLAFAGRIEEAREAARLLREGHPDITIPQIIAITPHRGDYVRRYAEGLHLFRWSMDDDRSCEELGRRDDPICTLAS